MPAVTVQQAFDLARQHHQAGRLAEAESLYHQVLAADPTHPGALQFLGVTACQTGRHTLAIDWLRRSLAVDPGNSAAHVNLGEACRALGRLEDAIVSYRHAIQLRPDYVLAHFRLANALAELPRLDEAVSAYRHAVALQPDFTDAHHNLAVALARLGRLDDAIAAWQRALEISPLSAEICNHLGHALWSRGRLDEALATYHRAIQLNPDYAEAHNNLGIALATARRLDEAVAEYAQAIRLQPDYPELHNNLGNALRDQGHLDDAIAAYRRALDLRPDYPQAHSNLGVVLTAQGRLDEALATYRRALDLSPQKPAIHSNLIYALHLAPGIDRQTILDEQHRWNRQFSDAAIPFIQPHTNERNPDRRLRIGYVSPEFRDHVTGRYLLPLFASHDHASFEIFCYSEVLRPDHVTEIFRQRADSWRNTTGLDDRAFAGLVRQDRIDILVDLTQHLAGNRLPVFALQPAPIQISFAGYPDTTGLDAIQYRLSDRWLEVADARRMEIRHSSFAIRHSSPRPESVADLQTSISHLRAAEQLLLLDSFWCYDPCGLDVPINTLPALDNGRITFGCLNTSFKVNEPVLQLWAKVLATVSNSRLVLLSAQGSHQHRTLELFEQAGIAQRRIEFVEPRPRRDYLELYHRLDIALDPFPYQGHTTSLDALWMGVPVITLVGDSPVSRAGLSQLTNLGLSELAAFSQDDYVRLATQLARDLPRLTTLRTSLRSRLEKSPLMDAPHFTHQIESSYRTAWHHWCAAIPPIPTP